MTDFVLSKDGNKILGKIQNKEYVGLKIWDIKSENLLRDTLNYFGIIEFLNNNKIEIDLRSLVDEKSLIAVQEFLKGFDVVYKNHITDSLISHLSFVYNADIIRISPDGKRIAIFTRYKVRLFDIEKLKMIWEIAGPNGSKRCVFSPDGSMLASHVYGKIQIWNVN